MLTEAELARTVAPHHLPCDAPQPTTIIREPAGLLWLLSAYAPRAGHPRFTGSSVVPCTALAGAFVVLMLAKPLTLGELDVFSAAPALETGDAIGVVVPISHRGEPPSSSGRVTPPNIHGSRPAIVVNPPPCRAVRPPTTAGNRW